MAKKTNFTSNKKEAAKKVIKAQKELAAYLTEHKLDPEKDWTKDKKHGPVISKWIQIIRIGEKKGEELASEKKAEKKKLKKPDTKPAVVQKIKKAPTAYDYPLVNGMPMSTEMKKRYRAKMRSLLKSQMDSKVASKKAMDSVMSGGKLSDKPKKEAEPKESKEKKTKVSKPITKPEKKKKKVKSVDKPVKAKDKVSSTKKVRKEED